MRLHGLYKNDRHQLTQHKAFFTLSDAFRDLEMAIRNNQLLWKLCNKFIGDLKPFSPSYWTQNEFY